MPEPPAVDPTERRPTPRQKPLLRKVLGDGLRRRRREQGRTLADVAAAARVSMQYLSELERGRKEASSEVLAALCDALSVDLADLLTDVWRPAVESRDRRASVVRLESIRVASSRARPSRPSGSRDTFCLAA
jgi:transcriptional regulator with XRE-family HTH domain